jgi:hypothetical protein
MLDIAEITYEVFITDSRTYVTDWVNDLDASTMAYTEIVTISGDGQFHQLCTAMYNHPQQDTFYSVPIGIIPGGSYNAMSAGLHGKNAVFAATNILRGTTTAADLLKVQILFILLPMTILPFLRAGRLDFGVRSSEEEIDGDVFLAKNDMSAVRKESWVTHLFSLSQENYM